MQYSYIVKVCHKFHRLTMPIKRKKFNKLAFLLTFLIALHNGTAQTWNGSGPDNNWTTAANWTATTPLNNGTASVVMAGSTRLAAIINAPWSIAQLSFATGAGAFALSGNTLTIGSGGISSTATTTQTIANNLISGVNQSWITTLGNITANGTVDLGGTTLTLNPSTARVITLSNTVSGLGQLAKNGAGTLRLGGANTFAGGINITAGTVSAGTNTAFGTGIITTTGGIITSTAVRTFNNNLNINGTVGFSGANQNYLGTNTLTGNSTFNNSITVTLAGLTESGGARTLTKSGTGTLLLNGTTSNTGAVNISGGRLALSSGATLSGGNLRLSGGQLASSGTLSRGLGTGIGQLQFTGTGGFAAYGGNLTISGIAGTPTWGTTSSFLTNGATLLLGNNISTNITTWTDNFSFGAANRTISVVDNTATINDKSVISGTISGTGGLIKTGTGRLDLTSLNSYTGATSIQAGEIAANTILDGGNDSSIGAGTGSNAIITLGSTTVTSTLRYIGTGNNSNRGIALAGSTGGGNIISDGTGALVISGNISGTVAGAKILGLSGLNTGANQLSGTISNGAGIIAVSKAGTGLWIVSGNNTYTGTTSLAAGELRAGSNTAFGTSTLNLTGGTLSASTAAVLGNNYNVGGNILIGGTNAISLSGTGFITSTRTITINNSANTTLSGPINFTEANIARTLTITGTGNTAVSGVITEGSGTGPDSISKSGSGTLTLFGANNYSGTTSLSGGALEIGNNAALGTSTLLLTSGTLQSAGAARTIGNNATLAGNITIGGIANLTIAGTTTLTANRILTINNSGATTLQNVNLSNSATSRTLTVTGAGDLVVQGTIANGGTATASALVKTGTGKLVLSGANTYGGSTTISAGTVEVRNNTALGTTAGTTSVVSGASLALSNNITIGETIGVAGAGAGGSGAILNISGNNTIITTITQSAASSITAQGGTLNLNAGSGNSVSGAVALTMGGTGNISLSRALNIGAATLTKVGAGTVTLGWSGANTVGTTNINAGTLAIAGSLGGSLNVAALGTLQTNNGSIISAGSVILGSQTVGSGGAGSSSFTGGVTYGASSTLNWDLLANSTAGPSTNFDQVLISSGNLSITSGAAINLIFNQLGSSVVWTNPFWASTRSWVVLDFSGAGISSGNFTIGSISTDSLGQSLAVSQPGATFSTSKLAGDVILTYNIIPEPSTTLLLGIALVLFLAGHRKKLTRCKKFTTNKSNTFKSSSKPLNMQ